MERDDDMPPCANLSIQYRKLPFCDNSKDWKQGNWILIWNRNGPDWNWYLHLKWELLTLSSRKVETGDCSEICEQHDLDQIEGHEQFKHHFVQQKLFC